MGLKSDSLFTLGTDGISRRAGNAPLAAGGGVPACVWRVPLWKNLLADPAESLPLPPPDEGEAAEAGASPRKDLMSKDVM